jgi:PilZ domain
MPGEVLCGGDRVLKDRRNARRFALRGVAKLQIPGSPFPRDCLVTDVSDGGARLYVEGLEVPDEFTLSFAGDERRACRVIWRLGYEVGVAFADSAANGFGRRAAASYAR